MNILKGFINFTYERNGALNAQVLVNQVTPVDNVILISPYGFKSNPKGNINGAMVLLFKNKDLKFAIPFNPLLEPLLESGESAVGNFGVGNKVTFKANGDIEVVTEADIVQTMANLTSTATTKITLTAPEVDISDAIGLVLNDAASMMVTIPGGSSAGTYPVTVVSAGQTKVKA